METMTAAVAGLPPGTAAILAGLERRLSGSAIFFSASNPPERPRLVDKFTNFTTALESRGGQVGIPIELNEGRPVGTLHAINRHGWEYDDDAIELLHVMARVVAYEIHRTRKDAELLELAERYDALHGSYRRVLRDLESFRRMVLDLPTADARSTICRWALDVTGASGIHLLEAGEKSTLVTSSQGGAALWPVTVEMGAEASGAAIAHFAGETFFVADAINSPAVDRGLVTDTGAASVLFEPVRLGDEAVAVLALTWSERQEQLDERTMATARLLGAHVAVAIDRARLVHAATNAQGVDPLTGLPTLEAWEQEATLLLQRAHDALDPLTVALLELPELDAYRDEHGAMAADRLLAQVTTAWRQRLG